MAYHDVFAELDACQTGKAKAQRRGDLKTRSTTDDAGVERVKRISTCMTPTQYARLREMAYKRHVSMASIIARLVDEEYERSKHGRTKKTKTRSDDDE